MKTIELTEKEVKIVIDALSQSKADIKNNSEDYFYTTKECETIENKLLK